MEMLKPIEPMLAVYAAGEDVYNQVLNNHNGTTCAELKYDGYRMQLHKKGSVVKAYTRNLNDMPLEVYPELKDSIESLPDCVLDCELVGGVGHAGFNVVKRRFRAKSPKSLDAYMRDVKGLPSLELRVFDVINYEGKWLAGMPFSERASYIKRIDEPAIMPVDHWMVTDAEHLKTLFDKLAIDKHEGLVCKNLDSLYIAGDRHRDWLKIKKFETLDLAVLGAYMDGDNISQLLCGTYNPMENRYETIAKVNAKREGIGEEVKSKIRLLKRKPSSVYLSPTIKEDEIPNLYVNPERSVVVEVKAMNINHGKN
ncbi:MAG: RNA ligase family protein, partial [Candidatus Woesearchaeota archaeon]